MDGYAGGDARHPAAVRRRPALAAALAQAMPSICRALFDENETPDEDHAPAPAVDMAMLKRLGVPDTLGVDARSFWAQMERVYDGVTARALAVAFADAAEE